MWQRLLPHVSLGVTACTQLNADTEIMWLTACWSKCQHATNTTCVIVCVRVCVCLYLQSRVRLILKITGVHADRDKTCGADGIWPGGHVICQTPGIFSFSIRLLLHASPPPPPPPPPPLSSAPPSSCRSRSLQVNISRWKRTCSKCVRVCEVLLIVVWT